jgi:superfamily II DNA or RNA helicase
VTDLELPADEDALRALTGFDVFSQGLQAIDAGKVIEARWHAEGNRAFGEVKSLKMNRTAMVLVGVDNQGTVRNLKSHCTCAAAQQCLHAVAILVAALRAAAAPTPVSPPAIRTGGGGQLPAVADWERSLAALLPGNDNRGPSSRPAGGIALQFDLTTVASRPGGAIRNRIGMHPVMPGARDNWIRTGVTWNTVGYVHHGQSKLAARHGQLLREIIGLYSANGSHHFYGGAIPFLDDAPSRRIWDLLAEAQELGLPLVQAGKGSPPVVLISTPAEAALAVNRTRSGLEVLPQVRSQETIIDLDSALLLGEPAHGIAWWEEGAQPVLRLAPMQRAVDTEFKQVLERGSIQVPALDEERFLRDYFPRLRQQLTVTTSDPSVELPPVQPPALVLTVERLPGHRLSLEWIWAYLVGQVTRLEPLWPSPAEQPDRDAKIERRIVRQASAVLTDLPALFEHPTLFTHSTTGRQLAPTAALDGLTTIRFMSLLQRLTAIEGLDVVLLGEADTPEYREADDEPVITITGDQAQDDRDWFNLAVTVSVGKETVPFDQLFKAIAQGQGHLILNSGTYFSLDHEEFRLMAELIAEAKALQDIENGSVRLSRFQAGLWEELERIGVVSGQAAQWQESVRALTSAGIRSQHPTPIGLQATLRPYQLAGFNWLAALYDYQLGGILADDMGLGKTLQALALFAHVREHALSDRPFLVIAPTSVVFNWATEAERFTPGLKVAAISETRARRRDTLAAAVTGADIVITSYTLFRLEYEAYAEIEWAGLVLDEAQFVKNHQSQAYQCVKRLPAPFKLAITGTPMENNLMELWALLSITAPGLFASPARFTQYYRTPIEKGRDAGLLEQLRRRIRPLMLRRTKQAVASDLPDKQEQVIELELNPKHRKVYQTHLTRERQKVLGLLDDLKKNRFEIFRSLTLLRQASLDVSLIDPQYANISSTKLDAMMDQVKDIVGEGHRTLIFSQFTRFLSSARDRLDAEGIAHCYLDGSTRDRAAVLTEFKTGTAPVFLISLKAGGFGLNLTEADYCILLDPWWNPATEAQAVDRVHRIGQTKKVMVYRLVAKDTIEEKVMALKAGKSALFSSVMDGGGFESATIDAEDIRGLLS